MPDRHPDVARAKASRYYCKMCNFPATSNPFSRWRGLTPLLAGIAIGFVLAFVALKAMVSDLKNVVFQQRHHDTASEQLLKYSLLNDLQNLIVLNGTTDLDTSPDKMAHDVRVLCWVMTHPDNHETNAKHVKATWGKRCNTLLFMSTANDSSLPAIKLPVEKDDRDHLWMKTREAFKYIYEKHFDDAEWFMKADDDTYVVVENLRHLLSSHSPKDPIWFGCHFKKYIKSGYMAGGAGYVLSKEAVRRFGEAVLANKDSPCTTDSDNPEDILLGHCMENVGVKAQDSRDHEGRWRFLPVPPSVHLIPNSLNEKVPWFYDWTKYHHQEGRDCCSDTAISFHYIEPKTMEMIDYFLYRMKPVLRITADMPTFKEPIMSNNTAPATQ